MNISVIGSGYVGLVTGACFADMGNSVTCIDNNEEKIKKLNRLECPIYEPGLEDLIKINHGEGRLRFTTDIQKGVKDSEVVFICVGTPSKEGGEADISAVKKVAEEIGNSLNGYKLIVEKSTVPTGTGNLLKKIIKQNAPNAEFDIASNPEFLKEGSAIYDSMNPDRIVLGVESEKAKNILLSLYEPIKAPIVIDCIETAELTKHTANSFLATKISFINEVANICERTGANVMKVAEGIGLDKRIGIKFLNPGIGYGGSCFPKDVAAYISLAEELGYDFKLLKEVQEINKKRPEYFVKKTEKVLGNLEGKLLGVLGLSFKPETDDMREAPSIPIINQLLSKKASIKTYDPHAMDKAKNIFKNTIQYCKNPYEVAKAADALLVLTEWKEFESLDLIKIKESLNHPIILDGRNIYNPKRMSTLGFEYYGIGRK